MRDAPESDTPRGSGSPYLRWRVIVPAIAVANATVWGLALWISSGPLNVQRSLGEYLSTTAIITFSTNLILVTRARPLERRLGGLDKLFAAHRLDGIVGTLIVASHFFVVPKTAGIVVATPFGFAALAWLVATVFVAAAPRAPWRRLVPLPYHQWKFLHRLNGVLVALAATHSLVADTFVKTSPLLLVWVYGIVTTGLLCYVYREFLFSHVGPLRDFRVSTARVLDDRVTELRLQPVDQGHYARRAGQFAFISLSDGPSAEQHPFTISSSSADPVRFSMKASGDWTDALADAPADSGSSARLEGPYGCFDYRAGQRRQLWLAGGIGITPFAAMLPEVEDGYDVLLVWSVHNVADAFYRDELEAAAAEKPGVRVVIHPTAKLGHLGVSDLGLTGLETGTSAFVCGPAPMRRAFIAQLKDLGMPRREIFFEEFTLR